MTATIVLDSAGELAAAAAQRLVAAAEAGAHIALTGGSTPRAAYERAAAAGADWRGATAWFGDERCVEPDHPDSNYGMARAALLDPLGDAAPRVHRMRGELGPEDGAAAYEAELLEAFGPGGTPRLDMVLLGLGPDGHCASMFPGKPAVRERERWAVGVLEPGLEPHVPRITMTMPVLNAAREVVFLVSGEEKADAVVAAFRGGGDPAVPASLVAPDTGSLTLLLDRGAAARLEAAARL